MADPPLFVGAVNATATDAFPEVPETAVGGPGGPAQLPELFNSCASVALAQRPVLKAVIVCTGPTMP